MNAETENYEAFESYSRGLDRYRKYSQGNDQGLLEKAMVEFEKSLKLDPNFFMPKYYRAVIKDLMGDFKAASRDLYEMKETAPKEFHDLVRYSLAVSLYHFYKPEKIEESITHFDSIKSKDFYVNALAKAGKLQSIAVGMMLNYKSPKDFSKAKKDWKKIKRQGEILLVKLHFRKWIDSKRKRKREDVKNYITEIKWVTYNAMGLATMYMSDTIRFEQQNSIRYKKFSRELESAREYFLKADGINPNHWAILSNMGSLSFRKTVMGFVHFDSKWEESFKETIQLFNKVLMVRPDYDFAYYEMGKLSRMTQNYDAGIHYFEEALKAQENTKKVNVPTKSITNQIERCQKRDSRFF